MSLVVATMVMLVSYEVCASAPVVCADESWRCLSAWIAASHENTENAQNYRRVARAMADARWWRRVAARPGFPW